LDPHGKVDEIERRDALEIVRVDHERLACTLVHAIDTDGAHVLIALQVANPDSVSHARRVAESVREGALRVACAVQPDALRRTQTHSDALRRTQTHSDALRCTQTHSDALSQGAACLMREAISWHSSGDRRRAERLRRGTRTAYE
jgi:hypothetical protein